jgi:hypothetical protein
MAESGRPANPIPESWLEETTAEDAGSAPAENGEGAGTAGEPVTAAKPSSRARGTGRATRPRPTS